MTRINRRGSPESPVYEARTGDILVRVSPHCVLTDGRNLVEEVRGEGVVGERPVLGPREAFRYQSGCPLTTPSGAMRGSYQMVNAAGDAFEVEIPAFSPHLP